MLSCIKRETLLYLDLNSLLAGSSLYRLRHRPGHTGWSQRFQLEGRAAPTQDFLRANKTEYYSRTWNNYMASLYHFSTLITPTIVLIIYLYTSLAFSFSYCTFTTSTSVNKAYCMSVCRSLPCCSWVSIFFSRLNFFLLWIKKSKPKISGYNKRSVKPSEIIDLSINKINLKCLTSVRPLFSSYQFTILQ